MNDLAMALVRLCRSNRDGSYATQSNRRRGLSAIALDLYDMGFRLKKAAALKPKHVTALVERWQGQRLSTGTLKNRLGWVRWWAAKVNKPSVIPKDNTVLGIAPRGSPTTNRAWTLPEGVRLADPRMQLSLEMMAAFGLRLEEALKLRPGLADKGGTLQLKGSWTKGGRPRRIPILTDAQRKLLDRATALVGNASLIPPEKSYIAHRKSFEHQLLKAGLKNPHGLRHHYAQMRFKALTGFACPKAGGPTDLTAAQRHLNRQARLTISRELGHNRLAITTIYLG